jgi:hypothetical protein
MSDRPSIHRRGRSSSCTCRTSTRAPPGTRHRRCTTCTRAPPCTSHSRNQCRRPGTPEDRSRRCCNTCRRRRCRPSSDRTRRSRHRASRRPTHRRRCYRRSRRRWHRAARLPRRQMNRRLPRRRLPRRPTTCRRFRLTMLWHRCRSRQKRRDLRTNGRPLLRPDSVSPNHRSSRRPGRHRLRELRLRTTHQPKSPSPNIRTLPTLTINPPRMSSSKSPRKSPRAWRPAAQVRHFGSHPSAGCRRNFPRGRKTDPVGALIPLSP